MTTTKPPAAKVSSVLNAVFDYLIGDLLKNKQVTKFLAWASIAAAAVFHSALGLDVTTILASSGGAVAVAHAIGEAFGAP